MQPGEFSSGKPASGEDRRNAEQPTEPRSATIESERNLLAEVFKRSPSFMAVVRGPEHVFELANDRYYELVGHRQIIGKAVREALPEVEGQGFFGLLDRVYATGEPFVGRNMRIALQRRPGQPPEERDVEFVYQALRGADGMVSGVFAHGVDLTEHKRAESALRASSERYHSLFTSIDEGFCVIEVSFDHAGIAVDYRFLEANPAFERQTGLVDAVGRTARELVPTLEASWFEVYGRVATTGEPIRFTQSSDPMGRWFSVYAFRVGDPDRRMVAILFNDVTEAKRADAALRESEARFRLMADAIPQIVWITDQDGRALFFNQQWSKYTGAPYQPVTAGEIATEFVHPDDRAATMAAFETAQHSGQTFRVEHRIRSASGEYRWFTVQAEPSRDPETGAITRWFGASTDISDRRRAEDALRDSEARLLLAVSIAEMGTFEIDLLTEAVVVNSTGREIYGWAPSEPLTFSKVQAHFHPDDREEVMRRVGEALQPGGTGEFEVEQRIIRTDGVTRWIRVRGRALHNARTSDGHATRCVGTYLDITRETEAAQQREALLASERSARALAERASQTKDEFLATLSHELRTPLNAILGWSQILRANGGASGSDLEEGLATIQRNARAQTQIIEDLLDMSRIISGKLRLDVQRIDLAGVVHAGIETVRPAAEAKGVRLQAILDRTVGPISGDPNRLQQVFWNLLSNAVKFTPRGGRVQVLLERVDSHLEASVVDTGQGISPQFLPHVFDRFRQADASSTRQYGGLGLGLSIVKQLVELHGGTVRASSAGLGRGSIFTVMLPLVAVPPDLTQANEPAPSAATVPVDLQQEACLQLQGVRVLVVDDEADACAIVRRLLEDCGAVVRTASSAQEAMTLFKAEPPDVLVSDVGMPGEDGYTLIRQVRALGHEKGGNTPSLALTAYARPEDRMRAVRAGFHLHVVKPVEPAELITMVASLANRNRQ